MLAYKNSRVQFGWQQFPAGPGFFLSGALSLI
jgi:hypothetical protein